MKTSTYPEIEIFKKSWDEDTTRLMGKIDLAVPMESIKGGVDRGEISLYEMKADGLSIGIFLVRIEQLWGGIPELAILYGAAESKIKVPFTSLAAPFIEQIAREAGVKSIRIHSERKGLDAIAEENGYKFLESVFRKRLE